MNKQNYSGCAMQPYTAPTCEMHEMVPECMICQTSGDLGNLDDYINKPKPWQY